MTISAPIPFLVLNAFTDRPLSGNPAAVVLLPGKVGSPWPDVLQLLGLARQFNLSQTAYLLTDGPERWKIRWFSPEREVPLCGHASLAACGALRHWQLWSADSELILQTQKRGAIRCSIRSGTIAMNFPSFDTQPTRMPERVERGLALPQAPVAAHTSGPLLLLEMATAELVQRARPNPRVLRHWHRHGVALTAPDSNGFHFITRMFAPRFGIDEDPACGSAHCVLGPYWATRLNKTQLLARQGSARGGQIGVHCLATAQGARVELSGCTLVALQGNLSAPLGALLMSASG